MTPSLQAFNRHPRNSRTTSVLLQSTLTADSPLPVILPPSHYSCPSTHFIVLLLGFGINWLAARLWQTPPRPNTPLPPGSWRLYEAQLFCVLMLARPASLVFGSQTPSTDLFSEKLSAPLEECERFTWDNSRRVRPCLVSCWDIAQPLDGFLSVQDKLMEVVLWLGFWLADKKYQMLSRSLIMKPIPEMTFESF